MIAPLVLLPLLLAASIPDDVALIRIDPDKPQKNLWVEVHAPATAAGQIYGAQQASDQKFQKAGGKKPVRFAFGAQWNAEGLEELVVVRELKKKKDRRLELLVYGWPGKVYGDVGKVLAKSYKKDLGFAVGDGRVVAMGPIDVDGDHTDEVMLVREAADGRQWLEIRCLPKKKKGLMGSPVQSDLTFGQAGSDGNVSLFGTDVDGDGNQDIVVLRRGDGVPDSLQVFHVPGAVNGETGPPFRSDLDVAPAAGGSNLGIWRMRSDTSEAHRALFLIEAQGGAHGLALYGLPGAVGSDLGTPLATHADTSVNGHQIPLFAAFGVRDGVKPPEPWTKFQGNWQAKFYIIYPDGMGGFISTWLGPFTGFKGTVTFDPNPYLKIDYPLGTTWPGSPTGLEGYVNGWQTGSLAYFQVPGLPGSPRVFFFPKVPIGVLSEGDYIDVTYPWGNLEVPEVGLPVISAGQPGPNPPYIGNIFKSDFVTGVATVYMYRFERVP